MRSDERQRSVLRIASKKRRRSEDHKYIMLVRKAFQFELYGDSVPVQTFNRYSGARRFVWNKGQSLPKWEGQFKTNVILKTVWKQEFPWLYDIHFQVLQSAIVDLGEAYKKFFAGQAGPPNKKKKFKCQDSFRYPQGFKIEEHNNRIYLPKIGWVRYRNSQPLQGTAKNVTIIR